MVKAPKPCVACGGKGLNSKGGKCYPCGGTGLPGGGKVKPGAYVYDPKKATNA